MESRNLVINRAKKYHGHTSMNFDNSTTKSSLASKLTLNCLEEICKHLKDDKSSLFSCILLNRSWCKMAIPVLWSRPFANPMYGNNLNIFWTYISSLPIDKKRLLASRGIKLSNLKRKPLFDYPKYLKGFDCLNFQIALNQWVGKTGLHLSSNNLMDRLSPAE